MPETACSYQYLFKLFERMSMYLAKKSLNQGKLIIDKRYILWKPHFNVHNFTLSVSLLKKNHVGKSQKMNTVYFIFATMWWKFDILKHFLSFLRNNLRKVCSSDRNKNFLKNTFAQRTFRHHPEVFKVKCNHVEMFC